MTTTCACWRCRGFAHDDGTVHDETTYAASWSGAAPGTFRLIPVDPLQLPEDPLDQLRWDRASRDAVLVILGMVLMGASLVLAFLVGRAS